MELYAGALEAIVQRPKRFRDCSRVHLAESDYLAQLDQGPIACGVTGLYISYEVC